MSKIKKYTIDEEIPNNVKASDLLETIGEFVSDGSAVGMERKMFFYFLVEEESERGCVCGALEKDSEYNYHTRMSCKSL